MKNSSSARCARFMLAILVFGFPSLASAQLSFSNIVVFGTSLSDPGNAFTLLAHPVAGFTYMGDVASQSKPPYDTLDETLVPDAPYAKGGHHFTNGATWIEQFAQGRGYAADVAPALQSNSTKAHNYAVGGARATNHPDRFNLPQQVQAYLNDVGSSASADALYVFEFGSNDLRDALVQFFTVYAQTGSQYQASLAAQGVISGALNGIASNIQVLYGAGARKFIVWNSPRIDAVPAVTAFGPSAVFIAARLTDGFNQALVANVLTPLGYLPGIQIAQLDVSSKMASMISQPADFGLSNVTTPCITPNIAPFACQQPDSYFFWDGIHPTKAIHATISQLAATALANYPNP